MGQDQLFKALLREFFREFMELFYPQIAERLDFGRVTFLDKEAFTDLSEGRRREADLLVRIYTKDGKPELILIHVEIQSTHPTGFPARMYGYYAVFQLRHRVPILPIALYLAPGAGGLTQESHIERVFGDEVLRFNYRVIGLPDMESDAYKSRPNPLGPALSALMRPGATGDALRKAMILRERAIIDQNEARRALLYRVIDRYLPLDEAEETAFQQLLAQPEYEEASQVVHSSMDRAEEAGVQKGIERGLQQGIVQGIEQGVVSGMRRTLLRMLELRFGEIAPAVRTRVEGITAVPELEALLDRIVTAPDLDAMGLKGSPSAG